MKATPLKRRQPLKRKPLKPSTKAKSASWYRKESITIAKKIARSIGYCEWCGTNESLHGSHILSVGSHRHMAADTSNIICLCYRCHFHKWHTDPLLAFVWFEEKWPGRRQEIIEKSVNTLGIKKDWKEVYFSLKNSVL